MRQAVLMRDDPAACITAIVPAGGLGSRAACVIPKQYQALHGQAMLRWTVQALLCDARIRQVRVAVAPDDTRAPDALAGLPRTLWRPCGGATRARTVLAALRDAALGEDAWVLVHDAARPGLPRAALARLIDTCLEQGQGGLLALPVGDTVKRAQPALQEPPRVGQTVAREHLWLAQTPQLFPAMRLQHALQSALDAGEEPGDEASAVERLGDAPLLVAGSPRNMKVTWSEDFAWMERWLK